MLNKKKCGFSENMNTNINNKKHIKYAERSYPSFFG